MHGRMFILGVVVMAILHAALFFCPVWGRSRRRKEPLRVVVVRPVPPELRKRARAAAPQPKKDEPQRTKARPPDAAAEPKPVDGIKQMVEAAGRTKPADKAVAAIGAGEKASGAPPLYIDWGDSPARAAEIIRRGGMALVLIQPGKEGVRIRHRVVWDGSDSIQFESYDAGGHSYSNRVRRVEHLQAFAPVYTALAGTRPADAYLAVLIPNTLEREILEAQQAHFERCGVAPALIRHVLGRFSIEPGGVCFRVVEIQQRR